LKKITKIEVKTKKEEIRRWKEHKNSEEETKRIKLQNNKHTDRI
jgi:hypothetical protein